MSKVFIFFISAILVIGGLFFSPERARAEGSCFCSTVSKDYFSQFDPTKTDPKVLGDPVQYDAVCYDLDPLQCDAKSNHVDRKYAAGVCSPYPTSTACQAAADEWKKAKDEVVQRALSTTRAQRTELHNKGVIERLLPACVFRDDVSGECRHVNVFIKVAIDIADYVLSIVGALALVVFVYGGVLMVISAGDADRVQSGKNAMIAAFIGLIVIFGAYILVKFFANVVGVQSGFNLQ